MAVRRRKVTQELDPEKISAWSFSRWSTYDGCPRKAMFAYVEPFKSKYKHLDTGSKAMARGSRIHDGAETYVKAGGEAELDKDLGLFTAEFEELAAEPMVEAEKEWAFTREWKPTGWFARGAEAAWCRVKVDAIVAGETVLRVIDYKTGKQRPSHAKQMSLYGLAGFLMEPGVETVHAELWYTDQGEIVEDDYHRDEDAAVIQQVWEERTEPMLNDTEFKATPNYTCKWCHFSKTKGGPCESG